MKKDYQRNLSLYFREALGFALFLAWVYCSLFGCGLATQDDASIGMPTPYNLERIWMVSGLFEAIGGIIGIVLASALPAIDSILRKRSFAAIALSCAVLGNFATWYAWATAHTTLFWQLYIPAGALTGIAIALFIMLWSSRLSKHDESHMEFAIPLSFLIAFMVYFMLLLTKQSGVFTLVVLILMISASLYFAFRQGEQPGSNETSLQGKGEWQGIVSFGTLAFFSWVQVAFFRIISTPDLLGNRFTHYLVPFSCACVLSLIMFVICLRMSRYLNISLAYRWSLPLFMLSYVPIFIDYDSTTLRIIAFAINFLGMFGVQFGSWIGACKYLRRSKCGAMRLFGCYALGEGLGIFAGSLIGLYAVEFLGFQGLVVLSITLMSLVIFAVMVTGFNPNWVFHYTLVVADESKNAMVTEFDEEPEPSIEELCFRKAKEFQKVYGLTNREVEVAALLLAGRSRPFIRDELTVSINTVGSHVGNIFTKCGVHSNQELINLTRDENDSHKQ